jgi:hypothetical protein
LKIEIYFGFCKRPPSFPWGSFPGGTVSANPFLPVVGRDESSARPNSPHVLFSLREYAEQHLFSN